MTADEIREALRRKIEQNWSDYKATVLRGSSSEVFDHAEEIAAARFCCDQLTEHAASYPEECLEYLLRFEDPLTVVRDQWLLEQGVDLSEEFGHALWYLAASGSAEQDYPLDSANSPKQSGPAMC
ncbi:MAG: DUF3848 domain-containing protein [Oscillibacter sp.]|nr:DUF3848 domain-containing protein [Oscillibacter sp.]